MMSDFTEQEFNEAMEKYSPVPLYDGFMRKRYNMEDQIWDPYSDLNQLMPIAFKHDLLEGRIIEREFDDFIQSLRNDLWQLYLEGKSDE